MGYTSYRIRVGVRDTVVARWTAGQQVVAYMEMNAVLDHDSALLRLY